MRQPQVVLPVVSDPRAATLEEDQVAMDQLLEAEAFF